MKITKIKIKTLSDKYPILIGSGVIKFLPNYLKENSINFTKCLVIIDHKVPKKLVFDINKFSRFKDYP